MSRLTLVVCFLILHGSLRGQPSGHRLAFVSGMSAYTHVANLQKTLDDSERVAAALKNVGFEVTDADDATREDFLTKFNDFVDKINRDDTVLIYYAGHGVQANGVNYILPLDFGGAAGDLAKQGVRLDTMIQQVGKRFPKLKIFVLDACQDNPLNSKSKGSLAQMQAANYGPGTYIAMSTAPNQTASDGVFAPHFAEALDTPGLSISEVFIRVRNEVSAESKGRQLPYSTDTLGESFYFSLNNPGAKMATLTANVTFQPSGFPSSQMVIQITPNAGDSTYTANIMGGTMLAFTNGTGAIREHTQTFTFNSITPGRNVMALGGGSFVLISVGSLSLAVDQKSNSSAASFANGNVSGTLSLTGTPYAGRNRNETSRQSSTAATSNTNVAISGQLVGIYTETLVPKEAQGTSLAAVPPAASPGSTPAPVASGRPDPDARLKANRPAYDDAPDFCPSGCDGRIGDFKRVARYQYPHPTWGTLKCEEKVFQFPPTWPGGPYLHSVVCKGPNANGVPITLVNFRMAATDQVKDQDVEILFVDATGQGKFMGADGKAWRVKIYGTSDVESMTIQMAHML